MLGVLSACLSAVAGVYTEFIMKKNDDSLYWQNMQLYAWGSIFNAAALTFRDFKSGFQEGLWVFSLSKGFNSATYLLVLNFGCAGLFISWIMKFGDNIVKVYATSSAMLLTTLISAWLFGLQPTLQLLLGIVVAAISLQLYFLPVESLSLHSTAPRTGLQRRNSSKSLESRHFDKADKELA
jgi:UDP-sugar transporter A1/2/3